MSIIRSLAGAGLVSALVVLSACAPAASTRSPSATAPVASPSAVASVATGRTVTLAKGDPVGPDIACRTSAGTPCPRLAVTPKGFSGNYMCQFFDAGSPDVPWLLLTLTGDETNTKAYYGFSQTLWVVCDGVPSNKVPW